MNESDEVVEIKSGFHSGSGNFVVEYADNAPHIPTYANSNNIESAAHSTNVIPTGQNKVYCSKCGAMMIEGAKFCNKCGQAVNQPIVRKSNLKYRNLITCNSCGALVAKTAKSCPKCGAKTPGQLLEEAVTGIGCGLLFVPVVMFLIVFYVIFFYILN